MASVAGFAMAVGVGVSFANGNVKPVYAADTTVTFSSLGLSNGVQYNTIDHSSYPSIEDGLSFAFGNGANDGKYYTTGAAIRVYSSGHMTVTHETKTFAEINLTFGSGDGSNAITTTPGTYSNNSWSGSASSVTFNVGGSSGHRRIASVEITYESSSNKVLSSIALSGTYPTSFAQGDEFSHEGMTVTATYDDESTANVTGKATFSGYDMNQIGNQTVIVSYTENNITKTASYGISINIPTYSVTYHSNGATSGTAPTDNTEYEAGDSITVLGNTGSLAKDGYTWSGWSLNSNGSGVAYGPTYTETYTTQSSDIDFYPIWVKNVVPLPSSGTISIDPSILGSYGTDVAYTVEENNTPDSEFGFSCTNVTKGTGSNDGKIQFKASSGVLYSTTPLSYLRSVTVSGNNNSDAVIRYGTTANSGCTSEAIGTRNTYFKISNSSSNARYWTITIVYDLEDPASLTGLEIVSGADSVKKNYDEGESFDSTGLVIKAEWNNVLDTENDVTNSVVWDPNPLTAGTTSVTGTYTYGDEHATVTITGLTVAAPDFVLDANSNTPAGVEEDTSVTTSGEGKVNSSGVTYQYYALAVNNYNSVRNLEFNRAVSNAYLGNKESYGKYIRRIGLMLTSENFSKFTMYKGDSAIPGETVVQASGSGNTRFYDFNNDSEYFALKQTTTGTWVNISKIEIFLGSNIPVIDEVIASVRSGTYYEGTTLSTSDFDVTVTWTEGKASTHPTEGFTWTVNGQANGELSEGNNSVVVTYEGHASAAFNVVGAPAAAKDVVKNTLSTKSSLTYHYSKDDNVVTDSIDREFTTVPSDTNYVAWDDKQGTSGAVYEGKTAGKDNTVQLNNSGSDKGIITTTSGGRVAKVTIDWNSSTANNRVVDIYGKNAAYSSVSDLFSDDPDTQGTLIGSITNGTTTEATISGSYEFIAIRSRSGAAYLNSIEIDWAGEPTYAFTNVGIKFGGSVSTTLWDRLDSESHGILGYGVMLSTADYLGASEIKDYYDLARGEKADVDSVFTEVDGKSYTLVDGLNIKCFYNEVSTMPRQVGGNYVWDLVKGINTTNAGLTKGFTAVAFIRTNDDEIIFLHEVTKSAAQVAKDIIDANPNDEYDNSYLEGSLGYLAGLTA